jgi:predicted ABC-type ATPase
MSRPQMFLVAGVNGSGKSTFTRTVLDRFTGLNVIDPDAIARTLTGSFATIDSASLAAGKQALLAVQQCIERDQSFIVESTLSGMVYLRYLQQAKDAGFRTVLIYVALSSADLSATRVQARVAEGGHDIPDADIQRRYLRSFRNLKRHLQISDLTYIYDNSDHYRRVASFRNGLIHRQDNIPAWLAPYL